MEILLSVLLVFLGLALVPITRFWEKRARRSWLRKKDASAGLGDAQMRVMGMQALQTPPPEPGPKGPKVLVAFGIIVAVVAVVTVIHYWDALRGLRGDDVFFFLWLFLTMAFGMIVSVLLANVRDGKPLLNVQAVQLLLPLFFSIVVFYPIWAIANSGPRTFFAFYTAFLNGYFWDKIVASLKPVVPPPEH